jgi:hypothetical protein
VGKLYQLIDVVEIRGDARGFVRNTSVSRSAEDLRDTRGLAQFPYKRMLAATAAKNQNPHRAPRLERWGNLQG